MPTFFLTTSLFLSQTTVTSATYTFPCLLSSKVAFDIVFRTISFEREFTSLLILSISTILSMSCAKEVVEGLTWRSLSIEPNNLFRFKEWIGLWYASFSFWVSKKIIKKIVKWQKVVYIIYAKVIFLRQKSYIIHILNNIRLSL